MPVGLVVRRARAAGTVGAACAMLVALAIWSALVAPGRAAAQGESTAADSAVVAAAPADSAAADSARVVPAAVPAAPGPKASTTPLRTKPRRGGPYNVVADRLEGGRTALEGDVVMLIGNVTLSREGTTVTSSMGRYVRREGTIHLTGGVRAVDGRTTITALEATYNENSDLLTLSGQIVVRDRDLVLTSDFGSYDQTRGRAELWSRVEGREKGRSLASERLVYLRDEETVHALGRVSARDSTEGLTLTADRVDYDRRAEVARASAHPKLVQDARAGKGAVTVTGDTIVVESSIRVATAVGNVEVERDSLRARSGRLVFEDRAQRGMLTVSPEAWNEEVHVKGDTLEVFTRERTLDRLRVRSGGTIEYRSRGARDRGETSLLRADLMDVFFTGDDVDSLLAEGGASNAFTGAPSGGRRPETNSTHGDHIRLEFRGHELDRAIVTGRAQGTYRAEIAEGDTAAARNEVVTYEASRITYEVPKNRIRLEREASLRYQDIALKSPEVIFDVKAQILEARGNPVLEDAGDTLRGRSLAYDLGERKGTVFGARTRYQSGWYSGSRIRRLGDDVLDVRGARYTTCNLDDPHYSFTSNRMKIDLKDKIIARPIVFSIKHIPVLALPFWVFPIRQDRHSGMLVPQIQFGFNSSNGGFVRNAGYFWAANDYSDFTLSGDWYPQIPSWLVRGEARYKLLYKLDGQVNGSYSRRDDAFGTTSWDLRGQHQQSLGENTNLAAQANFTSSADYTRDPLTGRPLANRIDRFLTSTVSLNRRWPWASASVVASRRQDLDADPLTSPLPRLDEQVPSVSLLFPTRTLGRRASGGRPAFLPFLASTYMGLSARFLNNRTVQSIVSVDTAGATAHDTTIARQGYLHRLSLSDNRRVFGFVNLGPTLRYDQVIVGRDATGKRLSAGATWGLGVGSSFAIYGTSRRRIGPITAIRHVFNPQVSWSYQPDFPSLRATVLRDTSLVTIDRFPSFGGIGLSGARQSALSFGVSNRFEAKVRSRGGEKTLTNLLTLNTTSGYDFLFERTTRKTPWQPIRTSARIQPPNFVSADVSLVHDPLFDKLLRQLSASVGFRFAGGGTPPATAEIPLAGYEAQTRAPDDLLVPWTLSASLSYGGGRTEEGPWSHTEAANFVGAVRPTQNWSVNYYNQIDLVERRIVAQEWSVSRKLHCWEAQFVRRFSGGTADYYFKIGIVDRPEVFIDRGTTGLGSIGGLGSLGPFGEALGLP